jgi:hypothetical protein
VRMYEVIGYLPAIMNECFADAIRDANRTAAAKRRKTAGLLGDDEMAKYKEDQKQYRLTAVGAVSNRFFVAMLRISIACKRPTRKFFLWAQKAVGATNDSMKAAKALGRAYLGPTFLSKLTTRKSDVVYCEIAALVDDGNASFATVWEVLEDDEQPGARELILNLALTIACQWFFRFVTPCSSAPLSYLWLLESERTVVDEKRQYVAASMLADYHLGFLGDKAHEDCSIKILELWRDDLELTAGTGTISAEFQNFLLMFRAVLSGETQDVEGLNSRLQYITNIARRMEQPGADARLSMMVGEQLSADACASMHTQITSFLNSDSYAARFVPLAHTPGPDVPKLPTASATLDSHMSSVLATAFTAAMRKETEQLSPKYVYVVASAVVEDASALVLPWSFRARLFAVKGIIRPRVGGSWVFAFQLPICITTFKEEISDTAVVSAGVLFEEFEHGGETKRRYNKTLTLQRFEATYRSLRQGVLNNQTEIVLKAKPPPKPPKPKNQSDVP